MELKLNLKIGYLHIKNMTLQFKNIEERRSCAEESPVEMPLINTNKAVQEDNFKNRRRLSMERGTRNGHMTKQFFGSDIEYITRHRKSKPVSCERKAKSRSGYGNVLNTLPYAFFG